MIITQKPIQIKEGNIPFRKAQRSPSPPKRRPVLQQIEYHGVRDEEQKQIVATTPSKAKNLSKIPPNNIKVVFQTQVNMQRRKAINNRQNERLKQMNYHLWGLVLSFLDFSESFQRFRFVCKKWNEHFINIINKMSQQPEMQVQDLIKEIFINEFDFTEEKKLKFDKIMETYKSLQEAQDVGLKHLDKFRKGEIILEQPNDDLVLRGLYKMFDRVSGLPNTALWKERKHHDKTWDFLLLSLKNYPFHLNFRNVKPEYVPRWPMKKFIKEILKKYENVEDQNLRWLTRWVLLFFRFVYLKAKTGLRLRRLVRSVIYNMSLKDRVLRMSQALDPKYRTSIKNRKDWKY